MQSDAIFNFYTDTVQDVRVTVTFSSKKQNYPNIHKVQTKQTKNKLQVLSTFSFIVLFAAPFININIVQ